MDVWGSPTVKMMCRQVLLKIRGSVRLTMTLYKYTYKIAPLSPPPLIPLLISEMIPYPINLPLSLYCTTLPAAPHLYRSTVVEIWIFWCLLQRVMPSGFFILLRFFMRVDNVMIRVNDTRLHYQVTSFSLLLVYNDSNYK